MIKLIADNDKLEREWLKYSKATDFDIRIESSIRAMLKTWPVEKEHEDVLAMMEWVLGMLDRTLPQHVSFTVVSNYITFWSDYVGYESDSGMMGLQIHRIKSNLFRIEVM